MKNSTKITNIGDHLSILNLYIQREDLGTTGSHKGRSLPTMIKLHHKAGWSDFVISSSGNAAIAAAQAVQEFNKENQDDQLTLQIFVGEHIAENKFKKLNDLISDKNVSIKKVERAKQSAFQLDKQGKAKFLRQSTDDLALLGYESLAKDLLEIPNLQAVFIPTSSGTTAQALGEYFIKNNKSVQVHIVQTEKCNPIAQKFDSEFKPTKKYSIASGIVDKIAHRKSQVVEIVNQTEGFGWVVSDELILQSQKLIKEKENIDISPTSAMSIAGLIKAVGHEWKWDGAVVCLITGP